MGQYKVTAEKKTFTATGIGSCLVITLYDRKNRNGGMAHATLPSCVMPHASCEKDKTRETSDKRRATYVDSAIGAMLQEMEQLGAQKQDIICKIVGGSNMFPNMEANWEDIGQKNVECAKQTLQELQLPLVAESIGGTLGRSVEFCVESGLVIVKLKF